MNRSGKDDGESPSPTAMASSRSRGHSSQEAAPHDRPAVLVVDDDPTILGVIEASLAGSDYRVYLASSGKQALEILRWCGGAIDLLLVDVQLPDLYGPQLSEQVVGCYPGVRVLFMSGFNAAQGARYGLSPGEPLLVKPFGMSELLQRVRQVLLGPVPFRPRTTLSDR